MPVEMSIETALARARARQESIHALTLRPGYGEVWGAANAWACKMSRSVASDFFNRVLSSDDPSNWAQWVRDLARRKTGRYLNSVGQINALADTLDGLSTAEDSFGLASLRRLIDNALREANNCRGGQE